LTPGSERPLRSEAVRRPYYNLVRHIISQRDPGTEATMYRIPEGRVTPTFASSPASAAWGLFVAVPNLLIAENRDHVAGPDHVAFPHANFENARPVVFAATAESSPSIRPLRTTMLAGTAGAARNIFQMKHAPAGFDIEARVYFIL